MRHPLRGTSQAYWTRLLEVLYSGLEQRDTTLYQYAPSDKWTQTRNHESPLEHLETRIDIGGRAEFTRAGITHSCHLMFASRFLPDDDSVSQARLQAAMRDAAEYLMGVSLPDGARVVTVSAMTIEGPYQGGWAVPVIEFSLFVPR